MRLRISHGGHVPADEPVVDLTVEASRVGARHPHAEAAAAEPGAATFEEVTFNTPFDYLFTALENDPNAHLPESAATVDALKDLGTAMIDQVEPPAGNSTVPPVYTYWGQFIDHDITANTDRMTMISDITDPHLAPVPPAQVIGNLKNLRQPALNLDSVYGSGPVCTPELYEGIKFKIGDNADSATGEVPPPPSDRKRDLPRQDRKALIADMRNDENLNIAQFHLAFLRFHNAAVDWIKANEPPQSDDLVFARARDLTRWHYQWLVVNDYLDTVTVHGTVEQILLDGPAHYAPRFGDLWMPLEFSVAAFRFGHSMVRAVYDFNRIHPEMTFNEVFQFTGNGGFDGAARLPADRIIEWDRFIDHGSADPDRFARKIDTHLALPLGDLRNEGEGEMDMAIKALLRQLAQRNLLRGYQLSIPTGQRVADVLGVPRLTEGELRQNADAAMDAALDPFVDRTPLWFYVLKEAEVRENGNSLGDVGSRVVAETIMGLIHYDPMSYLNQGWTPVQGVRLANGAPVVTIGDFLRFAGVLPAA